MKLSGPAAALLLLAGACMPRVSSAAEADPARGELSARPQATIVTPGALGLSEIDLGGRQPALLYVPEQYDAEELTALVVMLHGAGGRPDATLELVREHADEMGFIVLAPSSRASSWDVIAERRYGPDVLALDEGLRQAFAAFSIDPQRVAIAGFSDGASYALSLGLGNGELFSHIVAFSPGFIAPARQRGAPDIFISHGEDDTVLPIDRCSRTIVPQLETAGYSVDYREFPGGHMVPGDLARAAFSALD